MDFVIVHADPDGAILTQKPLQHLEARIHHTEPFVVAGKILGLFADGFAEPFLNEWAVDRVVINPALVSSVVRRIDVDALYLSGVVRQQRLERVEIVTFDKEIAGTRITATELGDIAQQAIGNLTVVIYDSIFTDPVKSRHGA
jgi:hypothetical protein